MHVNNIVYFDISIHRYKVNALLLDLMCRGQLLYNTVITDEKLSRGG